MAFVVRDYYEARQPIPADTQPPPGGSPLYRFIVRRLMDSFNLPLGITRYIELMQPAFPDVGLGFGLPPAPASWSATSGRLIPDRPRPATRSRSAWSLSSQAVARPTCARTTRCWRYGYDLDGTDLTLWLYDPNYAESRRRQPEAQHRQHRGASSADLHPRRRCVLLLPHAVYSPRRLPPARPASFRGAARAASTAAPRGTEAARGQHRFEP